MSQLDRLRADLTKAESTLKAMKTRGVKDLTEQELEVRRRREALEAAERAVLRMWEGGMKR